jgi:hypothetical protein
MAYMIVEIGVFVLAFVALIQFEPQIGTVGVMAVMLAVVLATGLVLRRWAR